MQQRQKLQLHNRISTPKAKKRRFCSTFWRNFKRKIISSKKWKFKMWKTKLSCRDVSKSESGKCENEARARLASKSESGRCANEAFVRDFPPNLKVANVKTKRSCVRDLLQNLKVEDVQTKRSCETSFKSESGKCENEVFVRGIPPNLKVENVQTKAFVRDLLQNLKAANVKTERLCEASLKIWRWKMWKRSFRARLPCVKSSFRGRLSLTIWKWRCEKAAFGARFLSKSENGKCENGAFVRDFLQSLKVQIRKIKPVCLVIPLLWHPFAVTSLCFDIPLLWHPFALTSLCFDIPLLWHPCSVASIALWHA